MSEGHIYADQGDSLARAVRRAGLRHGDKAELVLTGVGIESDMDGNIHMHFCPGSVEVVPNTVRRAWPWTRRRCMPSVVAFSPDSQAAIQDGTPSQQLRGFVAFRCNFESNGSLHIRRAKPEKYEVARRGLEIMKAGDYQVFQAAVG